MAGVWKKTLNYLGLVEDEEDFVDEYSDVQPAPVRQMRPQAIRDVPAGSEGIVRTIAAPRTESSTDGASMLSDWKPTPWQNGRNRITHSRTRLFGHPRGMPDRMSTKKSIL